MRLQDMLAAPLASTKGLTIARGGGEGAGGGGGGGMRRREGERGGGRRRSGVYLYEGLCEIASAVAISHGMVHGDDIPQRLS